MKYNMQVKATVLTAKERAERKHGSPSICAKVGSLLRYIFRRRKHNG